MNSTVLITGAYGFIGRNTSRYFASKRWNVIGIGHGEWLKHEWQEWGIREWHTCDITVDNLLTYAGNPDVIIHCAGSGSVGFSLTHPYQDYKRAVETTLSVLEFTRVHAAKAKVVFPSSAAVYGSASASPIKEECLLKPVSPYGFHKKVGEELCYSYAKFFSISVAVVRLFSVYGVGLRKQLLWDACVKLSSNDKSFFGTGDETRDWLHIQDAVALLYTASTYATPECPIVNGGVGDRVTTKDILREIFNCFQCNDTPKFLGCNREGDPQHYQADITNLQKWDWKPQFDLKHGIREYVEWFFREGNR